MLQNSKDFIILSILILWISMQIFCHNCNLKPFVKRFQLESDPECQLMANTVLCYTRPRVQIRTRGLLGHFVSFPRPLVRILTWGLVTISLFGGFVWFCLILLDSALFCLIIFDSAWFCLILLDSVWFCLILFDSIWFCLIWPDLV